MEDSADSFKAAPAIGTEVVCGGEARVDENACDEDEQSVAYPSAFHTEKRYPFFCVSVRFLVFHFGCGSFAFIVRFDVLPSGVCLLFFHIAKGNVKFFELSATIFSE